MNLIKQFFLVPTFEDEDKARAARLLNIALHTILAAAIAVPLLLFVSSWLSGSPFDQAVILSTMPLAIGILGLHFLMRRGYINLVSVLLSLLLLISITGAIYTFSGIRDTTTSGYILVIILASLLLGKRNPILFMTLGSIIATLAVYVAETQGLVTFKAAPVTIESWIIYAIVFALTGVLMRFAMYNLNEALERARHNERQAQRANQQLQDLNLSLEQIVAERTRALETSIQVSRRLSTILNQEELIAEVVEQVRAAFNYYHVHVYLVDEANENLILAGGTGTAGQTMLARGHKLAFGRGLVGRAAATNTVVLVPDTAQEEGWLPNPLLPQTRAEVAVPIALGERVLGVLDVQHNVVNGLQQKDADLLRSIAGQVAIALQNARLFAQTQAQAARDALIYNIGQKIQSTTSVDSAMQIAVRELGRAIGTESRVRLDDTIQG